MEKKKIFKNYLKLWFQCFFSYLMIAQMGKLMVSVLIETFASLKLNRPALRNRILLALGLNPHDDHEIISK